MSSETAGESGELPARRRTLVMLAVVCGVLLMSLDGAIANIALPTIARDLKVSDAATVWVVNAYNVGSVICLLPAAALGLLLIGVDTLGQAGQGPALGEIAVGLLCGALLIGQKSGRTNALLPLHLLKNLCCRW